LGDLLFERHLAEQLADALLDDRTIQMGCRSLRLKKGREARDRY
jgi:hypothetical protein